MFLVLSIWIVSPVEEDISNGRMHQSHGGNQPSLRENIHIREFLHGRGLRPICDPPTDTKTPLYRIYTEVLSPIVPKQAAVVHSGAPPIRTKFSEDQALFTMTAPLSPFQTKGQPQNDMVIPVSCTVLWIKVL